MRINLPYPSNWSDFQDLCAQLWKELMCDMESHQNGRNGQRQNGVDFYGKYLFDYKYTGVQCKGKNGNYESRLSIDEIDAECKKATNFKPQLGTFVMATTSPRDVNVQQHCRELTNNKAFPFTVDTWSWDDIEDEVQCRPEIMDRFYPKIKDVNVLNEIKLSRIVSPGKLYAYFSRPGLFGKLNKVCLEILRHIASELASNAFEHGSASTFTICIDGNRLELKDDGMSFNPLSLITMDPGRGGRDTLFHAKDMFNLSYVNENGNTFIIEIPEKLFFAKPTDKHRVTLNANDIFGRTDARKKSVDILMSIPDGTKTLIVDISGEGSPTMSGTYGFFDSLISLKTNIEMIKVYYPFDLYYKNCLIDKYANQPNIEFTSKD